MPAPVRRLLPDCLWEMPGPDRTLYLTFDDGPVPEETPFVLAQLAEYDARATFFCVGENLVRHPGIARAALAAGHRLANHTHHHISGWSHSQADFLTDVARCQQELNRLLPAPEARPLLRPPFGRITRPLARALSTSHQVVMWDVLTYDYDRDFPASQCLQSAIRHSRPGSIVVFHDSVKARRNLRYVLPRYLAHFAGLGFRFAAL
ncbi:polysaccharide deacetylase family protein [Hymenobacter fastidiosus]|uniref:Polysaccharide deacetylase family protein n=2 Tax=Hymenobacter fastidiosus TaxID=486264 RepID=A0ABP7RDM1_9BACT